MNEAGAVECRSRTTASILSRTSKSEPHPDRIRTANFRGVVEPARKVKHRRRRARDRRLYLHEWYARRSILSAHDRKPQHRI